MNKKVGANNEEFYNLDDLTQGLKRKLAPGLNTRIFVGDNLMLSVVEIDGNSKGEVHSHPEEQWGVLLEGNGTREQDGVEHAVTTGDFWRTPGGVPHNFTAGPDGAKVLDIFSPPREAYKKSGADFAED